MYRRSFGVVGAIAAAMVLVPGFTSVGAGQLPPGIGAREKKPVRQIRRVRRLNRSQHWAPAIDYKHARQISPYPDRPVR